METSSSSSTAPAVRHQPKSGHRHVNTDHEEKTDEEKRTDMATNTYDVDIGGKTEHVFKPQLIQC